MKSFNSWAFIAGLILGSCNQANTTTETKIEQSEKAVGSKDKIEITTLIRQVLNWAESKKGISVTPVVQDKKGKFWIGFDIAEHKQNLLKLKAANLFAAEFINNYNQLILTLDQQLKKGSYGPWLVGDRQSFNFASNDDPWCSCQDVPYDKPNPYDFVETEVMSLDGSQGELNWKWGGLGPEYEPQANYDPGWKKFKYRFRVVKENNQWKIAYLEGFDFKISVAKNF
jgi:hypothetical protein